MASKAILGMSIKKSPSWESNRSRQTELLRIT
jgi:hypothetical protein